MPCFNEEGTIRDIVAKVLAADRHGLDIELIIVDDGSGQVEGNYRKLRKSDDRIKSIFQRQDRGVGRRSPGRDYISVRRNRSHSGCRPGIRTARIQQTAYTHHRRQRRCSLRLEVHRRRKSPCSVFLAQCCKPHTDSDVQYDNQPEPHRYGVLLQDLPRKSLKRSISKRIGSGSGPKSRPRSPVSGLRRLYGDRDFLSGPNLRKVKNRT